MSSLKVALLTSSQQPTLGAFILHSGCSLDMYSDLDEFLVKAVSHKFDLVFCDEEFLSDENNEDRLLRLQQRNSNLKFFILSHKLQLFKLPAMGTFNPEDLTSIKKVFNEELSLNGLNQESDVNGDEIVIAIDEETEEEQRDFDVVYEVQDLKKAQSLDDLGKALMKSVSVVAPEKRGLVFKYLPNYCSLVVLSSTGSKSISKFNGMGLNFSSAKDFNPKLHLSKISGVPAFKKIIDKAFKGAEYQIFPLEVEGVARLLLALEIKKGEPSYPQVKLLSLMAEEKACHILMKGKYYKVKVTDELTGLLTRENFFEKMQDEYTRAKRIFLPVTSVIFEIDNYQDIKEEFNMQRLNTLLKMMAKILKENVRHNDYIGKVSESRFGILFPHMSFANAKNKIAKLREVIDQTKFFSDMKESLRITTSSSLMTYPQFSHSADEGLLSLESSLDRNTFTDTAIELTPQGDFRPDFEEIKLPFSNSKPSDKREN